MLGRIFGAALGAQAAKQTSKVGGPLGAAIGATVPVVLRRLSIPAMIAIAAGGYALKKLSEKRASADVAEAENSPSAKTAMPVAVDSAAMDMEADSATPPNLTAPFPVEPDEVSSSKPVPSPAPV